MNITTQIALIATLYLNAAAPVDALSTDDLVEWCQEIRKANHGVYANNGDIAYCLGYFMGFTERDAVEYPGQSTHLLCARPGVSNTQAALVFLNYTDDHPEWLDQPAYFSVLRALMKAFPCN
jgi:Rap1a immunity proteins